MPNNKYLKFILQVIVTVLAGAIPFLVDGVLDVTESINLVIIGLGAIGVLGAGNLPAGVWSYMKAYIAGLTAVATLLASFIIGGVDTGEVIQMILAFLGALGVAAVPGPRVVPAAPSVVA